MAEELSVTVNRLVELTKQITEAKKDIKILTQAEKALRAQVQGSMEKSGIGQINLKKGKINLKKSKRKAGFTKATVREGLTKHFQGDENTVDAVFATIQENLPIKEVASLSLTGIKEKSDK